MSFESFSFVKKLKYCQSDSLSCRDKKGFPRNKVFWYLHLVWTLISNVVPYINLLLQPIDPPMDETILLQIDNPKPVPYRFLALFSSSFPKSRNSFFYPSSEMPIPVSWISMRNLAQMMSPFNGLDELLIWSMNYEFRIVCCSSK